ncbi:CPBP family intramembrane glutamic endopeptidase [Eubacterium oxidoreducens]|uniref:Membrane protease YdiL, CAAX protease family n=1 Tax=Eubacterium oxidoreducens TaxID=1732 RepID=A0A1G6C4D4_EUBOX|nr:CPBP family intramembrane glutamic endopeptidase [Eubacterium oxidoreducens]SDB27684.1 Membrane protease YdiL, CAAX protease family [Eubacterium oxidoreducens]
MNGKIRTTLLGVIQVLIYIILNGIIYQILALMFQNTSVPYNLLAIISHLICLPLLLRWRRLERMKIMIAPRKQATGGVVVLALVIAPLLNNLIYLSNIMKTSGNYQNVNESFGEGAAIWLFLYTVIMTPIAEELLYRGILYEKIKECYRPVWGILISAIVFGIVHANIPQFFYATGVGVILALVYRQGGLRWCIMTHAAVNLLALVRRFDWIASWEGEREHILYESAILAIAGIVIVLLMIRKIQKIKY